MGFFNEIVLDYKKRKINKRASGSWHTVHKNFFFHSSFISVYYSFLRIKLALIYRMMVYVRYKTTDLVQYN